mmetsp:Transcript_27779/g.92374  ORF Transcript_27779/g.92374 Transcript_27779/m.92374 type:complete len:208 (-) Transcript_27779:6-629(-)
MARRGDCAEECLLLEVTRRGVGGDAEQDEPDAGEVEGGQRVRVAEGEERDSADEAARREVLEEGVAPALHQGAEEHRRQQLARLEEHARRVVEVLERRVGEVHAGEGQQREAQVLVERANALPAACDQQLEVAADRHRRRRHKGHPAAKLEARHLEHALLQRGKEDGAPDGGRSQHEEERAAAQRQGEAEALGLRRPHRMHTQLRSS